MGLLLLSVKWCMLYLSSPVPMRGMCLKCKCIHQLNLKPLKLQHLNSFQHALAYYLWLGKFSSLAYATSLLISSRLTPLRGLEASWSDLPVHWQLLCSTLAMLTRSLLSAALYQFAVQVVRTRLWWFWDDKRMARRHWGRTHLPWRTSTGLVWYSMVCEYAENRNPWYCSQLITKSIYYSLI